MMPGDILDIKKPDPDSHFRLLPCKACRSENIAYVRYQAGAIMPWRVQCFDCGHVVDKGAIARHDAQIAWNEEAMA